MSGVGSAVGAVVGTIIAPGVGTAIGAALGGAADSVASKGKGESTKVLSQIRLLHPEGWEQAALVKAF